MASIVKMPKMSDTMTEGLIVSWLKQEGDTVESGEIIAELETDKAVLELDSSDRGVLLKILVEANRTVPLGKPLAIIGERNENINDLLLQIQETTSELSPERLGPALQTAAVSTAIQSETDESAQIRVSPVVRRLADEHRIDLGTVRGSGPGGRIIKRDIETFLENPPDRTQTPPPSEDRFPHNDIPLSPFRLTAIRRLSQSLGPVPHFYLESRSSCFH